jgi:membrane protease YdiL (CAAX protease family)
MFIDFFSFLILISADIRYSIIWLHFKEFFGLPKIVLTALSVFAMYSFLANVAYPKEIALSFYMVFLIIIFYQLFKNKKKQEKENQKWLFKNIIFNYGSTNGLLIFLFQILNSSFYDIQTFLGTNLFLLFISTLFVMMSIFGFIILSLIPSKAEEYLSKTYPEYNLEKL